MRAMILLGLLLSMPATATTLFPVPSGVAGVQPYCFWMSLLCDRAGSYELVTTLNEPFYLHNVRIVNCDDICGEGVPATFPISIGVGEAIDFEVLFSSSVPGQFNTTMTFHGEASDGSLQNNASFLLEGSTSHGLCLYTRASDWPGHASVKLIPNDGSLAGSQLERWGKYPSLKFLWASGDIRGDAFDPWTSRVCYSISPQEYLVLALAITAEMQNTSTYSINTANCVDFVGDIFQLVDDIFPLIANNSVGVSDPLSTDQLLQAIGHLGKTPPFFGRTGYVELYAERIATEGIESPVDFSYEGLILNLFEQPEQIAATLGYPFAEINLGAYPALTGAPFNVQILNFSPAETLLTAYFGEHGPAPTNLSEISEVKSSIVSHIYTSTEVCNANLVLFDAGAIRKYTWQVNVSSAIPEFSFAGNDLSIVLPSVIPLLISNPGGESPSEPPPVDSLFSDGFEPGNTSEWTSNT